MTPRCADCPAPAVVIITAGTHGHDLRSAAACPTHHTKLRTWAARAGPPHETPTGDHQEQPHLF